MKTQTLHKTKSYPKVAQKQPETIQLIDLGYKIDKYRKKIIDLKFYKDNTYFLRDNFIVTTKKKKKAILKINKAISKLDNKIVYLVGLRND